MDVAFDGKTGHLMALGSQYDIILLDIGLPHLNGYELCELIRRRDAQVPILMLTALGTTDNKVEALTLGADDYVVKPFAMAELVARVTAVLRRRGRIPSVVEIGDLVVDPDGATARRGGALLDLTATEFRLLCFLAEGRGRTLSKAQILTQVWGYDDIDPNIVEVHLSALRRKMEAHGPRLIHTIRGLGYRMSAERIAA